MVDTATVSNPELIADFAAGGGALLEAGTRRWPKAVVLATDLDAGAVALLRDRHPTWHTQRLDFSQSEARLAALPVKSGATKYVVLLNPPFSERGAAARWRVTLGGACYSCGRALAFACWAAEGLPVESELVCLLPAGAIHSERDSVALAALASLGEVEVLPCEGDSLFAGYRLRTAILRLRKESPAATGSSLRPGIDLEVPPGGLIRGQARAWTEASPRFRGPDFVHTTDMRENRVVTPRRLRTTHPRAAGAIRESAVLLPRVGRPDVRKVCVWSDSGQGLVLSDCVIAIRTSNVMEAEELSSRLRQSWALIELCYGGTCAPYITLRRLAGVLGSLGVEFDSAPERSVVRELCGPSATSLRR